MSLHSGAVTVCTNHHLGYRIVQVCYDQMIGLARNSSKASNPNAKKQHPEYKSTLSETSRDKWEKITALLY